MEVTKDHPRDVAIIVFARSYALESKIKMVAWSKSLNARLWQNLRNASIKAAADTNVPCFVVDENEQGSGTFGQKISRSIHNVFGLGYTKLIVIGGDCPSLRTHDILASIAYLSDHNLVLGPDRRGGIYLLGIHRDSFDAHTFESFNWQTASLLDNIKSKFGCHPIQVLRPKSDINHIHDIKNILTSKNLSVSLRLILSEVLKKVEGFFVSKASFSVYHKTTTKNRGSPVLF